jgi:hypothetical protein
VDPIRKRGVTSAEGAWEIHDQDGGHIQEEIHSTKHHRFCRLFADQLPIRQPDPPGF